MDVPTITLPLALVRALLVAESRELDQALVDLRRAYIVATGQSPDEPLETLREDDRGVLRTWAKTNRWDAGTH